MEYLSNNYKKIQQKERRTFSIQLTALILVLVLCILFSIFTGRIFINPITYVEHFTATGYESNIILNARLPRIIGAVLIGASLSVSGLVFQNIFKNPLVSPNVLGVSSGSCVGAAIAILLGLNLFWIQFLSFSIGLLTVFFTLLIANIFKKESLLILILSGIIISAFMTSALGLIKYIADPDTQLQDIVYWQLGTFSKINLPQIIDVAPLMVAAILIIYIFRWRLNILSLDDKEALKLGVNIKIERLAMIILATLLTTISVSLTGIIGWIGLVIPHLSRVLVGLNNTKVVPVSIILGSIFLLVVDNLSRSVSAQEIPISIFTGFIGAPLFFWALLRKWDNVNE